ncbi:MAG: shikimate dehydrogenase family protein [Beutenbergiaceae bacterium]
MMDITGTTRIIGVVGDPISQARAPRALNDVIAAQGLDIVTIPLGIAEPGLTGLIDAVRSWRNLAGLIITMPYKTTLSWLTDELSPAARLTGAVNVIRREDDGRLLGDQLDGAGFVSSLRDRDVAIGGRRVFLMGTGGVGRAIAFGVLDAGAASVSLHNRSAASADDLLTDLQAAFGIERVARTDARGVGAADIVINATSVGSAINPGTPIDVAALAPGTVVADVIANPEITPLLASARDRGCTVISGRAMQRAQMGPLLQFLSGDEHRPATRSVVGAQQ